MSYDRYNTKTGNTSPWLVLQSIKSQFRNTESNCNDIIVHLNGGESCDMYSSTGLRTIIGTTGNIYNFTQTDLSSTNPQYNVYVQEYIDGEGYDEQVLVSDTLTNLIDGEDDADLGVSFNNILTDVYQAMSSNALVADICHLLQTSSTVSISDVYALISESDVGENDKKKILNVIKNASIKGKISSQGFIASMQSFFQLGYDTADDGSIIMDRSSPFAIQSLVSTVFQAFQTVISSIALLLRGAFGMLLLVLSQLSSTLLGFLNKEVSDKLSWDPNSDTFYVQGPVKYCDHYVTDWGNSNYWIDKPIRLIHFGPFDFYTWYNKIDGDDLLSYLPSLNGFITVGFDVVKALKYLAEGSITVNSAKPFNVSANMVGTRVHCEIQFNPSAIINGCNGLYWKNVIYGDSRLYMSQKECYEILADPDKLTTYIGLCLMFDRLFDYYATANESSSQTISWEWDSLAHAVEFHYKQYYTSASNSNIWTQNFTRLLCLPTLNSAYAVSLTSGSVSDWLQHIQGYYNTFLKQSGDWDSNNTFFTDPQNSQTYKNWDCGHDSYMIWQRTSYNSGDISTRFKVVNWFPYGLDFWGLGNDYDHEVWMMDPFNMLFNETVDTIPGDRAITIPSLSFERVISILAIAAVSVAATVASFTVAGRIITKRGTAKRMESAKNLTNLRDAYMNDPSNASKYNAYYKAVRRYNLKAKLLGWKRYDAVNNWFDSPESSVMGVNGISNTIPSLPTLLTNVNQVGTGVDNVNSSVSQVSGQVIGTRGQVDDTKTYTKRIINLLDGDNV